MIIIALKEWIKKKKSRKAKVNLIKVLCLFFDKRKSTSLIHLIDFFLKDVGMHDFNHI
jgi:hypothetical protein